MWRQKLWSCENQGTRKPEDLLLPHALWAHSYPAPCPPTPHPMSLARLQTLLVDDIIRLSPSITICPHSCHRTSLLPSSDLWSFILPLLIPHSLSASLGFSIWNYIGCFSWIRNEALGLKQALQMGRNIASSGLKCFMTVLAPNFILRCCITCWSSCSRQPPAPWPPILTPSPHSVGQLTFHYPW